MFFVVQYNYKERINFLEKRKNVKSKTITEKHVQDMERIKNLRLIDDNFMTKVFEDKECVEILLKAIIKKNDLKVSSVNVQYDIKNLQGRSVRLDVLAEDKDGKMYNIEIQRNNHGAIPKRARYNSSLLDANITDAGEDYKNLAETYVIFITEGDIFGANKALYHVDRIVKETKKSFGDEAHIIYVNSKIQNNTVLGRLMHDFYCTDAKDIKNRKLAKRVKFFKEDKEGVKIMSNVFEEIKNEGAETRAYEIARSLITLGVDDDKILQSTKLSKHVFEKLKKEVKKESDNLKAV
ncbi:Rpn family recombination-promoting nuclease/putative transposase [Blautia faecis]|nr:Rpn family recombination-promoting nuclease/putative transposase [Blautia faecis]